MNQYIFTSGFWISDDWRNRGWMKRGIRTLARCIPVLLGLSLSEFLAFVIMPTHGKGGLERNLATFLPPVFI